MYVCLYVITKSQVIKTKELNLFGHEVYNLSDLWSRCNELLQSISPFLRLIKLLRRSNVAYVEEEGDITIN